MSDTTLLTIERKAEVLKRLGLSRSTLHAKVQAGLWCPPIKLGARAIGFLKHETDALIYAHMNSYTEIEIRDLVTGLIAERVEVSP